MMLNGSRSMTLVAMVVDFSPTLSPALVRSADSTRVILDWLLVSVRSDQDLHLVDVDRLHRLACFNRILYRVPGMVCKVLIDGAAASRYAHHFRVGVASPCCPVGVRPRWHGPSRTRLGPGRPFWSESSRRTWTRRTRPSPPRRYRCPNRRALCCGCTVLLLRIDARIRACPCRTRALMVFHPPSGRYSKSLFIEVVRQFRRVGSRNGLDCCRWSWSWRAGWCSPCRAGSTEPGLKHRTSSCRR